MTIFRTDSLPRIWEEGIKPKYMKEAKEYKKFENLDCGFWDFPGDGEKIKKFIKENFIPRSEIEKISENDNCWCDNGICDGSCREVIKEIKAEILNKLKEEL